MIHGKSATERIINSEKIAETDKPMRLQAIICVGEYPIKTFLKQPSINKKIFPIFIEKTSEDIYKWLPNKINNCFVLGFEETKIDTHFYYNVHPAITKNLSLIETAKKNSIKTSIIFTSIWDGVGSASLPALISKFKTSDIDSLSIAIAPSKIQPTDAHFNAYAAIKLSTTTEGATVLLIDRDHLENYQGVNRVGTIIKGDSVSNYLLELLEHKDLLVEEIAELSRSFNVKLFAPLLISGASLKIYGSLENMLNAALLKPLLTFDLSSASLLYVLIRMPTHLADKLSRSKIELAVTNWFKTKTTLQSIHVTEPIYTHELNDRIDAVLFIGGFDTTQMLNEAETKILPLKQKAVERGLITDDLQVIEKIEADVPKIEETQLKTESASAPPSAEEKETTIPIKEPIIEDIEQTISREQKIIPEATSTKPKKTE